MRKPVLNSVGLFVQQSNDKVLAARSPFFSGRVRPYVMAPFPEVMLRVRFVHRLATPRLTVLVVVKRVVPNHTSISVQHSTQLVAEQCCVAVVEAWSYKFMKLFRTSNIDIVNYCRAEFNFELPGTVIEQRTSQFRDKYVTIFIVNCCV